MPLKLSRFDGGEEPVGCPRCGQPTYYYGKCPDCAKEIAEKVAKEFYDNLGHEMTEAIMKTGNEQFIRAIEEGAKAAAIESSSATDAESKAPTVRKKDRKNSKTNAKNGDKEFEGT